MDLDGDAGRSAAITAGGFVAGTVVGAVLNNFLRVDIVPIGVRISLAIICWPSARMHASCTSTIAQGSHCFLLHWLCLVLQSALPIKCPILRCGYSVPSQAGCTSVPLLYSIWNSSNIHLVPPFPRWREGGMWEGSELVDVSCFAGFQLTWGAGGRVLDSGNVGSQRVSEMIGPLQCELTSMYIIAFVC